MPLQTSFPAPDVMNSSGDLDTAAIERLRRLGGGKFTTEMIRLFLGFAGEKLAEARRAQRSGDLAGVEKAVHPIKSSAGNVGAVRIQHLAMQAEQRAKEKQADAVSSLMDELETAFHAATPLLEAEMENEASADQGGG